MCFVPSGQLPRSHSIVTCRADGLVWERRWTHPTLRCCDVSWPSYTWLRFIPRQDITGLHYKAVTRFDEFCSCCCLPLQPQLACSTLTTWERPYSEALYLLFDSIFILKHYISRLMQSRGVLGFGGIFISSIFAQTFSMASTGFNAMVDSLWSGIVEVRSSAQRSHLITYAWSTIYSFYIWWIQ